MATFTFCSLSTQRDEQVRVSMKAIQKCERSLDNKNLKSYGRLDYWCGTICSANATFSFIKNQQTGRFIYVLYKNEITRKRIFSMYFGLPIYHNFSLKITCYQNRKFRIID